MRVERKPCTRIGAHSYRKAVSEYSKVMTDFLLFSLKGHVLSFNFIPLRRFYWFYGSRYFSTNNKNGV